MDNIIYKAFLPMLSLVLGIGLYLSIDQPVKQLKNDGPELIKYHEQIKNHKPIEIKYKKKKGPKWIIRDRGLKRKFKYVMEI
jgi:hypothetical protein